ncbi:MAG: type II toxin-antitoxin system HicB family antitoxin [Dehalococcoidia bacterium]
MQSTRDMVQDRGYILLTFKVHEEDGQYVSECDELGVASCGDTIQEAFDAIEDAVTSYLETLEEEGERERVFAERGIRILPGDLPLDGVEVQVRVPPNEYVSPHPMRVPTDVA